MKMLLLLALLCSCAQTELKESQLEDDFDSEYRNEYILDEYDNYENIEHP